MAWVEIRDFDQIGMISDLPARSLPINAVTSITNVGFANGKLTKLLGYASVYGTPTVAPYHLQHTVTAEGDPWVIYCGLNDVYTFYANTHTKITRTLSTYAATSNNSWVSTVLGGVVILNEGANVPQYTTAPTTELLDLPAWPSSWTCASIRAFREFLVAIDMTEGGSNYPQKLRWSHPADPGSVPSSWDETDTTKDAGTKAFSETPGILVDMLPMGSVNVIYKSDSAYAMQFIGGQFVFSFNKLFDIGVIGRNCVAEVEGQHVFLAENDIYLHSGGRPQSLLHKKLRDELFTSMDSAYRSRSRVYADTNRKQVWFLIPTNGTGWLDTAWIWNWRDNTWGKQSIPNLTAISVGGEVDSSQAWDSDTGTWDSDNTFWNNTRNVAAQVLLASAINTKLYQGNYLYQAEGVNFTAEAERIGIDFGDPNSIKVVRKVRPHFVGMQDGSQVIVSIGKQDQPEGSVTWTDHTYTIGQTNELWPLVRGRYIAWKVSMSEQAARTNLLTYSEQFDNALWAKTNCTVTANAVVGPDGTTTADKLIENTSLSQHTINRSPAIAIAANTLHTFSVYLKAAERTKCSLLIASGGYTSTAIVGVDLLAGTVETPAINSGAPTNLSATITSVGDGWYRASISAIVDAVSTTGNAQVLLSNGSTTFYQGTGVSGFYIWGAQLETGATPTEYIKTEAAAVNASYVAANDAMELESLELDVVKNGIY